MRKGLNSPEERPPRNYRDGNRTRAHHIPGAPKRRQEVTVGLTRDQRTEHEKQKGALVAQRAERLALLDRYTRSRKVGVMVALQGHALYKGTPGSQINLFYVGDVMVFSEDINSDVYPSPALMATLALAIGATSGFNGIPAPEPTHRVSEEAKRYNAELRARNQGRPDFA